MLVVEDNADTREVLAAICRGEGCRVAEAENGFAAMARYWEAIAAGRPFRLVVLDLALPLMDGITTAKRIRSAEGDVDKLPRAYIHGYTGQGEYLKSDGTLRRAGFDSVTVKPGRPGDDMARLIGRLREEMGDVVTG